MIYIEDITAGGVGIEPKRCGRPQDLTPGLCRQAQITTLAVIGLPRHRKSHFPAGGVVAPFRREPKQRVNSSRAFANNALVESQA